MTKTNIKDANMDRKLSSIKILINDTDELFGNNIEQHTSELEETVEVEKEKKERAQKQRTMIDDLCLVYELDYLGYLEIESKYLQRSIIPWLIATLKLIEVQQHVHSICIKVNAKKNSLIACKSEQHDGDTEEEDSYLFKHKLTNIFKITQLSNDPLCFGYIYRDFSLPNKCCLFAFSSNKINLVQMLIQLQYKAFKFKQVDEKDLIKKFELDFIGEAYINSHELSMPNLIEICMKKLKSAPKVTMSKSQTFPLDDVSSASPSPPQTPNKKKSGNKENLNKRFTFDIEKRLLLKKLKNDDVVVSATPMVNKKVLLNFSRTKLIVEDLHTNLLIVKLNYKKILYFNNSMLNQKYFCLAYNDETTVDGETSSGRIKALVFYVLKNSLIDDLIKEFAYNLTNLNYHQQEAIAARPSEIITESIDRLTVNRTCQHCPLQQYVQLCDHLNELLVLNKHEKIYSILSKTLKSLKDDKDFIGNLCNELDIKQNETIAGNQSIEKMNQLLCSLIYKLCYFKQMQHLHFKQSTDDENFNILNNIYDNIDSSESSVDEENNNTNSKPNLKRKFTDKSLNVSSTPPLNNNNNNKVIKLRKERLSLGNIYTNANIASINVLQLNNNGGAGGGTVVDMDLLNVKKLLLLNHRKSNSNKQQQQEFLSISFYNNNNSKNSLTSSQQQQQQQQSNNNNFLSPFQSTQNYYKRRESMRRSIFNKVIGTPNSSTETLVVNDNSISGGGMMNLANRRKSAMVLFSDLRTTQTTTTAATVTVVEPVKYKRFKTREDIRQFWKKIISEQILLCKMDQENKKLKAKALAYEQIPRRRRRRNMAFSYDEVEATSSSDEITKTWKSVMKNDARLNRQFTIDEDGNSISSTCSSTPTTPTLVASNVVFENILNDLNDELEIVDFDRIQKLVLNGVPQVNRDTVWLWLARQYLVRNQKQIQKNKKNLNFKFDLTYSELLKDNTTHQHAIMIDLGRTFPSHPNFSQQFGAGQLALFNVLKAYSILDPEVGYCQGLSFIVGVLLIHCDNDEERAFELLKHILINLGLRKQFKPDMFALQKYMYEITRLLYDNENQLYQHLEDNEASAQLYCAPWFLTLFASQFEMGFVARVFDFLFAVGPIILFQTSLAILSVHKPLLMHCDSFEVIINYLKITVPEMSLIQTEGIINKAFNYDIQRDLDAYEIEFYIFQEELQTYTANGCENENMRVMQLPPTITLAPIVNHNNLIKNALASVCTTTDGAQSTGTRSSLSGATGGEKRGSTVSLSSSSNNLTYNSQLMQVEQINLKLKEKVEDLLEQLQAYQANKNNQEDLVYKLQHENSQLKCRVETLEIERMSLLNQLKNDRD